MAVSFGMKGYHAWLNIIYDDLWISVCLFLNAEDFLSITLSCKYLHNMTTSKKNGLISHYWECQCKLLCENITLNKNYKPKNWFSFYQELTSFIIHCCETPYLRNQMQLIKVTKTIKSPVLDNNFVGEYLCKFTSIAKILNWSPRFRIKFDENNDKSRHLSRLYHPILIACDQDCLFMLQMFLSNRNRLQKINIDQSERVGSNTRDTIARFKIDDSDIDDKEYVTSTSFDDHDSNSSDSGIDFNEEYYFGLQSYSMLFAACDAVYNTHPASNCNLRVVKFLLGYTERYDEEQGRYIGVYNNNRNINLDKRYTLHMDTALTIACYRGNVEIVQLLINHPAMTVGGINLGSSGGLTGFHIACKYGNHKVVQLLLKDRRTDVNRANANGVTPLMSAIDNRWFRIGIMLLDHDCNYNRVDVRKKDFHNRTALSKAFDHARSPIQSNYPYACPPHHKRYLFEIGNLNELIFKLQIKSKPKDNDGSDED